jgi:hypothetical protein
LIPTFKGWDIRRRNNRLREPNGDLRKQFGSINFVNEELKIQLWFGLVDKTNDVVEKWAIIKFSNEVEIINIFSGIETFEEFFNECQKHNVSFNI